MPVICKTEKRYFSSIKRSDFLPNLHSIDLLEGTANLNIIPIKNILNLIRIFVPEFRNMDIMVTSCYSKKSMGCILKKKRRVIINHSLHLFQLFRLRHLLRLLRQAVCRGLGRRCPGWGLRRGGGRGWGGQVRYQARYQVQY